MRQKKFKRHNYRADVEIILSQLLESRLTNVEYHQVLLSREILQNVSKVIELTQPRIAKVPLTRIGRNGDGGYVVGDVSQSKVCLNLGVGTEVSADLDLISQNFKIYAFDGSVPNPIPNEPLFNFIKKNISYSKVAGVTITLQEIFLDYPELEHLDLLMLDIEGSEHKVLNMELAFIIKAKQIVIEFHGLELLADIEYSKNLIKALNELSETHYPIHVHANNAGGTIPLGGAGLPTILEVTFLRKEFCTNGLNYGPFPGPLDYPNVGLRPDIDLMPFYGPIKSYASLSRSILAID
jgi:hypothetical protein